jgi:hypothetical protein
MEKKKKLTSNSDSPGFHIGPNTMCWSCSANITSESYQHFRKSVECGMWTFGEGDIPLATKQKPLVCIKYLT